MTHVLVAVDPGKDHAGVTIAVDGVVALCETVKIPRRKDLYGPAYRQGRIKAVDSTLCVEVALGVKALLARLDVDWSVTTIEYVSEIPAVRKVGKRLSSKVRPEDLMFVQTTGGAVAGMLSFTGKLATVRYIYPEEHKGQIDPEVYWDRVLKIARKSGDEKIADGVLKSMGNKSGLPCDKVGHAIDSLGIAYWALWRSQ